MGLEYRNEDYTSPRANDCRFLTRVLGSIRYALLSYFGEWIAPRGSIEFHPSTRPLQKFIDKHTDYKQKLQYNGSTVVAVMLHPPHDGASNFLIQQILFEVNEMCRPIRPKAMQRTGRTIPLCQISDT
jgi:hypothetical protein